MTNENFTYARPESLQDALGILKAERHRVIAGGTDFYPSLGGAQPTSPVLDVTAIQGLRSIKIDESGVQIGALCTWADLVKADLPASLKALQQAAFEVGSVQIQSRATIAGNLCNASPAADGVPALLCCDAIVNLASVNGTRKVTLSDFILGNRRTLCAANELVVSITIPAIGCSGQSDFLKLGARKYLVISIAMVASRLVIDDGKIAEAAIAVGSCSEVATRLSKLEKSLIGISSTPSAVVSAVPERLAELSPIDDVRGTAGYRLDASVSLVRRSLERCLASSQVARVEASL